MSALDRWRKEIFSLLPRGFLRRDQGDNLFISDYPRQCADAKKITALLKSKGFEVTVDGGLARIDGTPEKYAELIAASPPPGQLPLGKGNPYLYFLALRLLRTNTPALDQPSSALRLTLKCLDAGDEKALERLLPPLLAQFQRKKEPLPTAAGNWILCYLLEKEASSC